MTIINVKYVFINFVTPLSKILRTEVVEVLKCLRRGKAPGPHRILNGMMMYGGGRLVEVMLQVTNGVED